ncbi:hypothetical protein PG990_002615 [Apiospora arundinis]
MEVVNSHAYPDSQTNSYPSQGFMSPGTTEQGQQHQWAHRQSSAMPKSDDLPIPVPSRRADEQHRKTILGLTVPVFWVLLIGLFLICAGAIGGGVGGGLAAQQHNNSNAAAATDGPGPGGPSSGTTTTLPPGQQPTNNAGGGGTVTTTLLPLMQPTGIPTDGCPEKNLTIYSLHITLKGQTEAQTFRRYCSVDLGEDGNSNPGVRDLLDFYTTNMAETTTLDQCMHWCAEYNRQYYDQQLADNPKAVPGGDGYCTAVSLKVEIVQDARSSITTHPAAAYGTGDRDPKWEGNGQPADKVAASR